MNLDKSDYDFKIVRSSVAVFITLIVMACNNENNEGTVNSSKNRLSLLVDTLIGNQRLTASKLTSDTLLVKLQGSDSSFVKVYVGKAWSGDIVSGVINIDRNYLGAKSVMFLDSLIFLSWTSTAYFPIGSLTILKNRDGLISKLIVVGVKKITDIHSSNAYFLVDTVNRNIICFAEKIVDKDGEFVKMPFPIFHVGDTTISYYKSIYLDKQVDFTLPLDEPVIRELIQKYRVELNRK